VQESHAQPEDIIDEGFTVLEPDAQLGSETLADNLVNIPENEEVKSEEAKKTD
jgi:energy-coupling factor transporter ATP-binding protein EcfA2